MRTKALLSVAAIAASAISAMAQNVYSLNIVGYANVPNPGGYTFQTAPFSNGVTNGANEILPSNTGQYDGDALLLWQGTGYKTYPLDSTSPTGFSDPNTALPIPAPILSGGLGYLYQNGVGVSNTLTYVGTVRTGTNVVHIPTQPFNALGSPIPFAGDVQTNLNLVNTAGRFDGDDLQILVRAPSGQVSGFHVYPFDSTSSTGFSDPNTGLPIPGPQISIGQGFFFHNGLGVAADWTQTLNVGP
jgi:hypothetical protein